MEALGELITNSEDSGLDGETVAIELGYASFEAFLHSPEMAPRILVGADPDGRPRYKVYPTKADLERYVAQQLGTDYGDTKRALARQRDENNRLRRQLASTMERVEKLKSEALVKQQTKPVMLDASRFRPSFTKTPADNIRDTFPRTDLTSRFRPADSKKDVDGPSTSRAARDGPAPPSVRGQAPQEKSALSLASPDGRPRYKVYPTEADLERYVTQQLGTDYGDTKRALARQRDENNRLRSQLASTMERVEKLKSEALAKHQPKPALVASRFRASSTKTHTTDDNTRGTFPRTDLASRFRPANAEKNIDGPSTSRAANDVPAPPSGSGQALQVESTLSLDVRRHIDDLERTVHCGICMDRSKDTAFACGHAYCNECAVELKQCTFGCKKQNGKPLTFKYRLFL